MHHEDPEDVRDSSREEPEDNLGLGLVDDVATQRPDRATPVRKWILLAIAVVVVVAGIVALVNALAPRDIVSEVAAAPDRVANTVELPSGGTASVAVSPSLDEGSIELAGLPESSAESTYQVWIVSGTGGDVSSLAVLEPDETEHASGFKKLADIESLLITAEPAGGSEAPSRDPLATIDLPR